MKRALQFTAILLAVATLVQTLHMAVTGELESSAIVFDGPEPGGV